jgi:hypothetical protein
MDLAFNEVGWIPLHHTNLQAQMGHVSINYTFWLNLAFGLIALALVVLAKRNPMQMQRAHCCGKAGAHAHHS